jgi:hypothetical protein
MNAYMIYNHDRACWMAELDGRTLSLHCGECFELVIGKNKMPCRLELDSQWYVIIHEEQFNLRTNDIYRVII